MAFSNEWASTRRNINFLPEMQMKYWKRFLFFKKINFELWHKIFYLINIFKTFYLILFFFKNNSDMFFEWTKELGATYGYKYMFNIYIYIN